MKLLIAAAISALALSGAGFNLSAGARAGAGAATGPAMELCVAGMSLAFGGERIVTLSMAQTGRCFCPDVCSTATLRLAGITLRL